MSAPERSALAQRARLDFTQDVCENAPFASVGGLEARQELQRPSGISEADWPEYRAAYEEAALQHYGVDWRTCAFGWSLALVIPGGESEPPQSEPPLRATVGGIEKMGNCVCGTCRPPPEPSCYCEKPSSKLPWPAPNLCPSCGHPRAKFLNR